MNMKSLAIFFIFLGTTGWCYTENDVEPKQSLLTDIVSGKANLLRSGTNSLNGVVHGVLSLVNNTVTAGTTAVKRFVGLVTSAVRSVVNFYLKYFFLIVHAEVNVALGVLNRGKAIISYVPIIRVIVVPVLETYMTALTAIMEFVDWFVELIRGVVHSKLAQVDGAADVVTSRIAGAVSDVLRTVGSVVSWKPGDVTSAVDGIEGPFLPSELTTSATEMLHTTLSN